MRALAVIVWLFATASILMQIYTGGDDAPRFEPPAAGALPVSTLQPETATEPSWVGTYQIETEPEAESEPETGSEAEATAETEAETEPATTERQGEPEPEPVLDVDPVQDQSGLAREGQLHPADLPDGWRPSSPYAEPGVPANRALAQACDFADRVVGEADNPRYELRDDDGVQFVEAGAEVYATAAHANGDVRTVYGRQKRVRCILDIVLRPLLEEPGVTVTSRRLRRAAAPSGHPGTAIWDYALVVRGEGRPVRVDVRIAAEAVGRAVEVVWSGRVGPRAMSADTWGTAFGEVVGRLRDAASAAERS